MESRRDSRGLILKAARDEFGRQGFAGGRVDRIARDAGVNKQLIFYYFRSKAGLFASVAEAAWSSVGVAALAAEEPGTPLERLRLVAERVLDAVETHGDVVRMTLLAASPKGSILSAAAEPLNRLAKALASLVSEGQGLGYVRDDVDPDAVARFVLATTVGAIALPGSAAKDVHGAAMALLLRAIAW